MNNSDISFLPGNRIKIKNYNNPWNNRDLWHSDASINMIEYVCEDVKNILEFGSYDGGDGIRYKYHFPKSNVYSIEASPVCYNNIKTLEQYGLKVFNYAISDRVGETLFFESYDPDNDNYAPCGAISKELCSTERGGGSDLEILQPIAIPCITVEEFCKEQKIEYIDVIHIDVEGHSVEVLNGFGQFNPKIIFIEVSGVGYDHSFEVFNILDNRDYNLIHSNGCDQVWVREV
jgi:FkbM family methyltransferase